MRPPRLTGRRRSDVPIVLALFALLYALALFFFSHLVIPPLASPDGLLINVAGDADALTFNGARLRLSPEEAWESVVLTFRLQAGEALNFIPVRAGDDFVALRLSLIENLPSARLLFAAGEVIVKEILPAEVPAEGELTFIREDAGIMVRLDGVPLTRLDHPPRGERFEVNLLDPDNPELFDRVAVREIRLADGKIRRGFQARGIFTAPWFLLAPAALITFLMLFFLGRPLLKTLTLNHLLGRGQVSFFLLSLFTLLAMVSFAYRFFAFNPYQPDQRLVIRILVAAYVLFSVGLLLLLNRPWSLRFVCRQASLSKIVLFPPIFLLLSGILLLTPVVLCVQATLEHPAMSPQMAHTDYTTRVICYGGSSTYGFPFPAEWPFDYPLLLEEALAKDLDPLTVVINLAAPGLNLKDIRQTVERDIDILHPTHIIIDSVVNNLYADTYDPFFEETLADVINLAREKAVWVGIVKEPHYRLLRHALTGEPVTEKMLVGALTYYDAIDRLAAEKEIVVIDPMPDFLTHVDEFLFIDGNVHLTKYGHARLARVIERAILDHPRKLPQ